MSYRESSFASQQASPSASVRLVATEGGSEGGGEGTRRVIAVGAGDLSLYRRFAHGLHVYCCSAAGCLSYSSSSSRVSRKSDPQPDFASQA